MIDIKKIGFTQGPWIDNDFYKVIQNHQGKDKLGSICRYGNLKENDKNMKLIQAAPAMLQALTDIINSMYNKDSTLANLNGCIINAKNMLIDKFPEIKE